MDPEEREDEEQRRLEFELAKPKEGNFLKRRFFRLLQRNPESGKSNLNAFISLLVLFLVYVLNQADRLVLAVVLPDGMRCDSNKTQDCNVVNQTTSNSSSSSSACSPGDCIDVSETGQGLLTGPAFTVVYVLAGIPLAWFSDKKSRLAVLVIGITFWSLMVLLTGFVKNFWELLLARIGLGLGEATCNPVAYSLISDLFLPENRATALSAYSFGIYLGGATGYAFGALNQAVCWRWLFRSLGIVGFLMVFVVLLIIRDPGQQKDDTVKTIKPQKSDYTLKETAWHLVTCPPYLLLLLAGSVRNLPGYAIGGWLATFYKRDLDQDSEVYGRNVAIIVAIGGICGAAIGGFLSDRLGKKRPEAKAYVIAVSQILAAPTIIGTLLASNAHVSYFLLFTAYITAETWVGVAAAIVQDVCMPAIRSQASAVYIAVITIVGGFGPLVISSLLESSNDTLFGKCNKGVRNALVIIAPTFYVSSALLFIVVGFALKRQQAVMREEERTYLANATDENDELTEKEKSISLDSSGGNTHF
ncbi:MFS-type efflux pump MSMEG_3705-like [Oscarella lobularis]|uniref:MFS-type efflux pump MSMEG_3705-like n=1 Tax=Oscarella lobularis TaxID=121494 RepID=UPI0033131BEE